MLARQLHRLDREVRQGGWTKIQGVSLQGKVLGVIGVGSIGRALVRRAVAIGMSVVGYDIASIPISFVKETGISCVKLEELLRVSDFISLNCTLTPESYHLLGTNEFALMKTGVYIVNTARGSLINEEALVQALREGKVAGAALDVFEQEPLPSNSPLREFDNCIFGTHNSSNTYEAVARTNRLAIQKLLDGLGVRSHE
jgi:D-3-phosphoglycerate dehydrogenase